MINKERLVERFLNYIKIDSETGSEKAICDFLYKELKEIGFKVERDDAGEKINSSGYNIYAFYGKKGEKDPILLSSHLDTVSPGKGVKPIINGSIISSDKTTVLGGDDKSGVAIIVEVMQTIKESSLDSRPIEAVFTICEEGGLGGAKNLAFEKLSSVEGIAIDSGGPIGVIYNQAPSQDSLKVKIKGICAHAGMEPEKGVSAIGIAARAIDKMPLYRVDGDTTANIGTISGGSATNIIASEVYITAEARSKSNEKLAFQTETMKSVFEQTASEMGGEAFVEVDHMYDAIYVSENSQLIASLKDAFLKNGFSPYCRYVGGGGDANVYFSKGIDVVNISSGMSAVHTVEEHIDIKDMESCANVLMDFLTF